MTIPVKANIYLFTCYMEFKTKCYLFNSFWSSYYLSSYAVFDFDFSCVLNFVDVNVCPGDKVSYN